MKKSCECKVKCWDLEILCLMVDGTSDSAFLFLGQVSGVGTSLEDSLLERGGNESWSPWMWWMMWNVLQQDTETWRRKRIWSKQIYLPPWLFHSCFPGAPFLSPLTWNWKSVTRGGKRTKRAGAPVPTKVRALAWRMQISATGRNWTTVTHMLHTFKPLYWKKCESVQ